MLKSFRSPSYLYMVIAPPPHIEHPCSLSSIADVYVWERGGEIDRNVCTKLQDFGIHKSGTTLPQI